MIDAIQALTAPEPGAAVAPAAQAATKTDFGDWLSRQVETLNAQIVQADAQVQDLALGQTENLHQVMMTIEKAKLNFELAMQVRNRVLEAYQDVMRMQI